MARPSSYTQEKADKICTRLGEGKSLRTICMEEGMPSLQTIFTWIRTYPQFLEQYTRAKEEGTEALADEILDIADNGLNDWMEIQKKAGKEVVLDREHVERSKLRIESRKWLLSKLKAKKYGDKMDHTTNGKDLPTPILGYVSSNNSNTESNGIEETNTGSTGRNLSKQDSVNRPLLDTLGSR